MEKEKVIETLTNSVYDAMYIDYRGPIPDRRDVVKAIYDGINEAFEMGRDSVLPAENPLNAMQPKLMALLEKMIDRAMSGPEYPAPTPEEEKRYQLEDFRRDLSRVLPIFLEQMPCDKGLEDFETHADNLIFRAKILLKKVANAEPLE